MAKSKNVDAIGVTVLLPHQGVGGPVKKGDQYVTDEGHAVALKDAGYVSIDNEEKLKKDEPKV